MQETRRNSRGEALPPRLPMEPDYDGKLAGEAVPYFRVEVSDHEGQIVAIEPRMLAGRDIGPREEAVIVAAIRTLIGFIGRGSL